MCRILKMNSYKKNESRMFSGRDYGLEVRQGMELDEKDKDNEVYIIQVSDDILAINSSFFGGLFSESVITLGEEGFREKYHFENEKGKMMKQTLRNDIKEGIYDALNG